MNKRATDKISTDVFNLEFENECAEKNVTQWNSSSSNEDLFLDSKSEVLWSRERNEIFCENDFFKGFHDSFSDLTERTNSSCSWHNDDFDMNSSIKVKASLEAIEDALYEEEESHLISKTVFQECCEWAKKFSYFRLKGEQIAKPYENLVPLSTCDENVCSHSKCLSSSLQVQGKKMAIHVPEKFCNKIFCDTELNSLNEEPNYFKEDLDNDDDYEECLALDTRDTCNKITLDNLLKNETLGNVEALEEKIVERISLEIWPKVLSLLQQLNEPRVSDDSESFQLPPIITAIQQRKIPNRRPKTEGTDLLLNDFPKLNNILTISPKILQSKQEFKNRKGTLKSSRPNSEINLSRRNYTIPVPRKKYECLKVPEHISHFNHLQQIHFESTKSIIAEKEHLNISSLLPALEEDIPESSSILRGISLEPEIKEFSSTRCEITNLSNKSECFLPPIEGKSPVLSNAKLTQNLFTFFGSPLKFDKQEGNVSAIRPTSRPYTSTSRKVMKFSGNLNHKLLNHEHSSSNNPNSTDTKKQSEINSDKLVTLFPIVTSLTVDKEKNAKKGFLNRFSSGKKR
ncbi:uncharacterized protein TNCV_4715151 [Trichonephila clavipes]|nr:uncharacterized protein TNCV_4715151 [Trichonephila clavipes]